MTRSELIALKIKKEIKKRVKEQSKLIIAIDGYAGSGKTTIADYLGKINKNVEVVHLDDFINHFKVRQKLMKSSANKPDIFEYQWYRYKDLEKLIKNFKKNSAGKSQQKIYDFKKNDFHAKPKAYDLAKKILVVDGIFLLHQDHKMNKLFDIHVYLVSDLEKADKRRQARDKKQFGKNYLPDDHPDNWVQYFKIAYKNYIKKHKPSERADLVFRV